MPHRTASPARRHVVKAGLGSLLGAALGGAGRAETPTVPSLDAAGLAAMRGRVPALAGLLVTPEGTANAVISGVRRQGQPEPATLDDLWHIGSCTKAMTAALYARFVEQGRVRFDTPVATLCRALAPNMHPDWAGRTAADVMAHGAGLTDAAMGVGWLLTARGSRDALPVQRAALVAKALERPPARQGAGGFAYANMNFVLIGAALEALTGTAWETLVAREIWAPLGMTSGGFGAPTGAEPWGHARALFGRVTPVEPDAWADNPAALGPAGTVHVSLPDWARFVRPFLTPARDARGFLSASSLTTLLTPRVPMTAGEPLSKGGAALGWLVGEAASGERVINHAGSNTVWLAQVDILPARERATLVAANLGPPAADAPVQALARALRQVA